jgi:hypothetical protein
MLTVTYVVFKKLVSELDAPEEVENPEKTI